VEWTGSSIFIHHDKCLAYGQGCNEACVAVCPTHIFHRKGEEPSPEEPKQKAPKDPKDKAAAASEASVATESASAATNA
jgi:hypothetical protein